MDGWKAVDWQLIGFVAGSIVQEVWLQLHLPRVYYWNGEKEARSKSKPPDDRNDRFAA